MAKVRARRDEPQPTPDTLAVRGILGAVGLAAEDLRAAAVMNHELYGFFGVSVWVPNAEQSIRWLEQTKLRKFSQYAAFTLADLTGAGLALWATGQSPHYDVVYPELDVLVDRMSTTPHEIRLNPHVDREDR